MWCDVCGFEFATEDVRRSESTVSDDLDGSSKELGERVSEVEGKRGSGEDGIVWCK